MSLCPCRHVHVAMSMSPCPCLHVHVYMSPCPCLPVSMSPFLHVSISPCFRVSYLCLCVSMSPSPCLHISMYLGPCLQVSGIAQTENKNKGKRQLLFVCCKRKTPMANFHLFAVNINGKRKFAFLGRQTIKVNDYCCLSKHTRLWHYVSRLDLIDCLLTFAIGPHLNQEIRALSGAYSVNMVGSQSAPWCHQNHLNFLQGCPFKRAN